MKNLTKILPILIVMLLITVSISAQPGAGGPPGGPSGGGTPECWPPPCIPIDGGVSFLIAIGAAFIGKKAYDHSQNSELDIE